MRLAIYSIQKILYEGEAKKIVVKTPLGETAILDHHLPLISPVEGPAVKITDALGNDALVSISSGTLEVRPESEVVILART